MLWPSYHLGGASLLFHGFSWTNLHRLSRTTQVECQLRHSNNDQSVSSSMWGCHSPPKSSSDKRNSGMQQSTTGWLAQGAATKQRPGEIGCVAALADERVQSYAPLSHKEMAKLLMLGQKLHLPYQLDCHSPPHSPSQHMKATQEVEWGAQHSSPEANRKPIGGLKKSTIYHPDPSQKTGSGW